MELHDLGYTKELEEFRQRNNLTTFEVGRVIAEHKERYIVMCQNGEFEAEITGNMLFTAKQREDFPAVGDWVALTTYDTDMALIHKIFPRTSIIIRESVGRAGENQIIAANVDYALLIQAIDRDFNLNRLERYLTICNASSVNPIIVLTKIDLIESDRLENLIASLKSRIEHIPILAISNISQDGIEQLEASFQRGKSYCMLGSSGVGKSTLLNVLSGKELMRTNTISISTSKGRHVTSHRELVILDNGGILIDNPGMREVGVASASEGIEATFEAITTLSKSCKFTNCTHTSEVGCSVLKALEVGELDRASYENYMKLEREKAHYDSSLVERRAKDKQFGKFLKNYKKDMKREGK